MKQILNKINAVGLVLLLVSIVVTACSPSPTISPTATQIVVPTKEPRKVVLTMGAWRTSTERLNRILDSFHDAHPNITVRFDPTLSGEYDDVLKAQLESGTAPDMFYLRSFSASQKLFELGYLEPLGDLPGLRESFDPPMLEPWSTENGTPYGVPFTATSHGIYYNKDIFEELGLSVPETWEELLATTQAIKDAGYIPFANATKDAWAIAEIIFMNLAPNFIGGREGRMEYLTGQRCFNDERVVSAFRAVEDLVPFFPQDHELFGYVDSLELFLQSKAVMWMSGSWDIPYFEEAGSDFAWSVFAIPPPAGHPAYITFHLDVAFGLNAASQYKDETREFLAWMTTSEFGELLGNELPGFFPMHRDAPTLTNEHANTFLALNQGRGTDIRFAWEKLGDGSPDGYVLMLDGTTAVIRGEQTPQEAADALQEGLAQWFEPAKECEK
ncbi:MAG: extracellular solute-binding protein [Chloroflexi bacterium]|nr:extracellular solute-binding protein [Chloroflexota bacterium]